MKKKREARGQSSSPLTQTPKRKRPTSTVTDDIINEAKDKFDILNMLEKAFGKPKSKHVIPPNPKSGIIFILTHLLVSKAIVPIEKLIL